MSEDDVLCCAQAVIAKECKHETADVCATMGFDPRDRMDRIAWLREKLWRSRTRRYKQSDSLTIRNLVLDARQERRKSRRKRFRADEGPKVSPGRRQVYKLVRHRRKTREVGSGDAPGFELLENAVDKPGAAATVLPITEQLATSAARVGLQIVLATKNAPGRKAAAMLTCFARLAAVVGENLGQQGANHFVQSLTSHLSFKLLPLSTLKRHQFEKDIVKLAFDGSLRRDLAAAGLHWPSTSEWNHFVKVLGESDFRLVAA